MKIFVSWSGRQSQELAHVICDWLPKVVPFAHPWMSTRIEHGKQWAVELSQSLTECHVGIVCLTLECLEQDWIAFEAGAVFAAPNQTAKLFCLRLGGQDLDMGGLPLAHFPLLKLDPNGLRDLAMGVNDAGSKPVSSVRIDKALSTSVDDVLAQVASIPPASLRDFELVLLFPDKTVRHQSPFHSRSAMGGLPRWSAVNIPAKEHAVRYCVLPPPRSVERQLD